METTQPSTQKNANGDTLAVFIAKLAISCTALLGVAAGLAFIYKVAAPNKQTDATQATYQQWTQQQNQAGAQATTAKLPEPHYATTEDVGELEKALKAAGEDFAALTKDFEKLQQAYQTQEQQLRQFADSTAKSNESTSYTIREQVGLTKAAELRLDQAEKQLVALTAKISAAQATAQPAIKKVPLPKPEDDLAILELGPPNTQIKLK